MLVLQREQVLESVLPLRLKEEQSRRVPPLQLEPSEAERALLQMPWWSPRLW